MWDFFETVRHRHSVRRYQPRMPVEDEKLHAILETACAAPSAGDLQASAFTWCTAPWRAKACARPARKITASCWTRR